MRRLQPVLGGSATGTKIMEELGAIDKVLGSIGIFMSRILWGTL
jgi:hypothetical protein